MILSFRLLLGVLFFWVWPGVLFAEGASVAFVFPRDLATVVGRSVIEIQVSLPQGARVDKVVVSVDGKTLATLTAPPWKTPWNAGDALEPHFLEAVLLLADGTKAHASIRTSRLHIDQFEQVSLVNLYAIVRDRQGTYVPNLTREDFRVTESGRPQVVQRFSDEWKPLRIGIVLDASDSMERYDLIEPAREAAVSLLEILRPEDQGVVVTFNDTVQVVQDLTSDRAALTGAIRRTEAKGGTALYDAIWRAADLLEKFDGRRVLVLLSDGRDEASNGLEPGSLHTEQEALDRALRSETMIFAIGFGKNLERCAERPEEDRRRDTSPCEPDLYNRRSLDTILKEMAETTGGRALFSSRAGKLRRAFEEVAEDLRHQYSLAYTSDDPRQDGSWREIRLATTRPDLRVITRKGYFAPREPGEKRGLTPARPRRDAGGGSGSGSGDRPRGPRPVPG